MASSKREFRVIKLCQKLCKDIVEIQGTADKSYRFTICQDIRKKSEDVIHIVRRANDLPAGNEERIRLQYQADELLEDIKDLIWIVGKILNTGAKKEAQIELSIENLQIPLHNWMERDQKIAVSVREKAVRKLSWTLYQAKKTYEIVNGYYSSNKSERNAIALEESKSRFRIAYADYEKAIKNFDEAVRRLRTTQERYHKDDSVLAEVLREIEEKTGIKAPDFSVENPEKPSDATVKEKKETVAKANEKILETNSGNLSESTVLKLKDQFDK